MKILHVVHGYHPSIGGSQWFIKNLSEQLLKNHNDDVTVFSANAYEMTHFWGKSDAVMPMGTTEENGVTVRRFPVFNRFSWLRMALASATTRLNLPYNDWFRTLYNGPIIFGLTQAIANHPADIVLAMAFPLRHMYNALNGAKQGGKPIVLIGGLHASDSWGFERPMIYKAIQQADAYIALTSFERDYLVERGIRPEKISVVGGGVDAKAFVDANTASSISLATRNRFKWGNAPVIAMIAKQTARKRFDTLLEAMPQVWAAHPDAQLVLAGAQTSYSKNIQTMINALSPAEQAQVTILNDISEAEKAELLASCDLLVLPSGEESFGIVFVEAWARGKPVIGANVGAVASLIEHNYDGLLFEYKNPHSLAQAIKKLLEDSDMQIQMGEAGRQKTLENYTWDVVTNRIRQVYLLLTTLR